jgi:hypothetical protein
LFGVPAVELSQRVEEKPMAVLEEQDRCELIFGPSVRFDFESGRTLVLSQGLQEQWIFLLCHASKVPLDCPLFNGTPSALQIAQTLTAAQVQRRRAGDSGG